jgi:hypothetical protein
MFTFIGLLFFCRRTAGKPERDNAGSVVSRSQKAGQQSCSDPHVHIAAPLDLADDAALAVSRREVESGGSAGDA